MSQGLLVPVSVGELFDKISILEIKRERIRDEGKLRNIDRELNLLMDVANSLSQVAPSFPQLCQQLKVVNEAIWDGEDDLRACNTKGLHGPEYVALSRMIHDNNDRRAEIKRQLNLLAGSSLMEEKSFQLPAS